MEKILIVGAGVMGTALAVHLANNNQDVNLWGTKWDEESLRSIENKGYHPSLRYVKIPNNLGIYYEDELEAACESVKVVIIAVLSEGIENISKEISPYLTDGQIVVNITKGIHGESLMTMSNIIERAISMENDSELSYVKLGGPVIAGELANGNYTEAVFASRDLEAAKYINSIFEGPTFKGNISSDIDGVELCASFKNSYAIIMGIMEGIESGTNNAKAALMSQGSREMSKIVESYGGNPDTAFGVAGIGDYYVTSQGGRNGIFGGYIGRGHDIDTALEMMNHQSVEGIAATKNGYKLIKKLEDEGRIDIKKDVPLFYQLHEILFNGKNPKKAMQDYWNGDKIK